MIAQRIISLLQGIGPLRISPSPYDTAWVARLPGTHGDRALRWLQENQLDDGSWGTPHIAYPHERLICTLSALAALAARGERPDSETVRRAVESISANSTSVQTFYRPATIGFELLAPALWQEVTEAGIDLRNTALPRGLDFQQSAKLSAYYKLIGRHDTPSFSLEAFRHNVHLISLEDLQSANGSISYSPSATAFYLLEIDPGNLAALKYLHRMTGLDGSVPYVGPIEVFDRAWTLWNLALIDPTGPDALDAQMRLYCDRFLDEIAGEWQRGLGVSAAFGLDMPDGDDTAMALAALGAWGVRTPHVRDGDLDGLLFYEAAYHFRCYPVESDPSVSTNVHALDALRRAGLPLEHASVQKALTFLDAARTTCGCWADKWHISPYYPTAHAVVAAAGYADGLVEKSTNWLLAMQRRDGSWGMMQSTAEETAYALQALVCWWRTGRNHDAELRVAIASGAAWLLEHVDDPHPPLWIGKSLYCPQVPVQAAIVSALAMAEGAL